MHVAVTEGNIVDLCPLPFQMAICIIFLLSDFLNQIAYQPCHKFAFYICL